jgi:putative ABC transport system permease protein
VSPILGRDFQRDEEKTATEAPVIISERLWRAEFASSPQVLGRTLRVEDRVRTVVGVMPDGFALPFDPFIRLTDPVDLYAPIVFDDSDNQVRRFHFLRLIGRLGSGVSMREAQAQMDTIARQLEAAYTENETWKLRLVSLHERMVGDLRRVLFVLFGAVLLLLLVACANVAGMLLARGVQRQNELALRVALGASRRRIFAQLMLESLLLPCSAHRRRRARCLARCLDEAARAVDVPRLSSLSVDWTVVLFAILLIAATTVLFGAVPAFHACRQDAADALRQGFRSTGARRRTVLRNGYVVTQIAVACALLAAAGLFVRSLWRLEAVDPGFATRGVVLSQLSLSRASFDTDAKLASWYAVLIDVFQRCLASRRSHWHPDAARRRRRQRGAS